MPKEQYRSFFIPFWCEIGVRASQSFLIGRLVDRETKPLRKHESAPHCRFPDHAGGAPISSCTVAEFENGVDNVRHFPGRWFVYEALTAIGKDCGHIGKKHQRVSGATKAGTRSHQLH
jgi:hypothetical protein